MEKDKKFEFGWVDSLPIIMFREDFKMELIPPPRKTAKEIAEYSEKMSNLLKAKREEE